MTSSAGPRPLELLAPAANAAIAVEAIKHGADAVYIGPPSHGARNAAANSFEDIEQVVRFAHIFGAKVYVTVNTLIKESELKEVERMIRRLYLIGVDALIIQDMAILRMDIPPIPLHASTQCDIRTPGKARFLEEVGFSQLVLARELSLAEIEAICRSVTIPVETFVHGALCVSYSGRCAMGQICAARSGNRGVCPQICRQQFTLTDARGRVLAKDRYLLSLKDFKADNQLQDLIEAGVSSFKIEGRLKEADYVKNVVSHYNLLLNAIIARSDGRLRRSSYGSSQISFTPAPEKSFNRGFTSYRLSGQPDTEGIANFLTPKSMGEKIEYISCLKPGDGISFFNSDGSYAGAQVNGVRNGLILTNKGLKDLRNKEIRRTSSIDWKKIMAKETAVRTLALDITVTPETITARDESGTVATLPIELPFEKAEKTSDYRKVFEKLGNTPFRLRDFTNETPDRFFPLSYFTEARRRLVDLLLKSKEETPRSAATSTAASQDTPSPEVRREENLSYPYPERSLIYLDNVANSLARNFYKDHGVVDIEPALEVEYGKNYSGRVAMTSKHCILRELGLCLKHNKLNLPLTLQTGNHKFRPEFNCRDCEMRLITL